MEKYNTECLNCGFTVKRNGYLSQHHKRKICIKKFKTEKNIIYNKFKYNMDLEDINKYNNLTQKDSLFSFINYILCKHNLFM